MCNHCFVLPMLTHSRPMTVFVSKTSHSFRTPPRMHLMLSTFTGNDSRLTLRFNRRRFSAGDMIDRLWQTWLEAKACRAEANQMQQHAS
jgi:hypothetical protein